MLLNEIFDTPGEHYECSPTSRRFFVDGREYRVSIEPMGQIPNFVEIAFAMRDDEDDSVIPRYKHQLTGAGNSVAVFSTVLDIIKKYVTDTPDLVGIRFTATHTEPSRLRLYDRMVKNFAKDWEYGVMDTEAGNRVWLLAKKDPNQDQDNHDTE